MLRLLSLRIYNLSVDPFGKLTEAALTRPITTDHLTTLIAREAKTDISGEESLIRASYYRPVKSSETPYRHTSSWGHTDVGTREPEDLDDIVDGSEKLVLSSGAVFEDETTITAKQRLSRSTLEFLSIYGTVIVMGALVVWLHPWFPLGGRDRAMDIAPHDHILWFIKMMIRVPGSDFYDGHEGSYQNKV